MAMYLKSGGGNYSAAGTWSATSAAGVDSVGPPTAATDVILELASGQLTIDAAAACRSFDTTSGVGTYGGTVTHNAFTLTIGDGTAGAGNVALKLNSGMTYTLANATTSAITFASSSGTQQSITWGSKVPGNVAINTAGCSYQMQDGYTANSTVMTHTRGTVDYNGKTFSTLSYTWSGSQTRVMTMGAASFTATGTNGFIITAAGLTVTANTATLTMTATSGSFDCGAVNLNGASVVMSGASNMVISTGGFTVANFTRTGTAVKTDALLLGGVFTVTGTLTFSGNTTQGVNRLIVLSSVRGTQRVITATGAAVVISGDVDFMDIDISGSPSWTNAGSAYVGDAGGNGTIIATTNRTAPATQTFTSGTKNWSDPTVWTSRVPLPQDDVVVNTTTASTLTNDMPRMGKNIDFTSFTRTFTMTTAADIYGSLTYVSAMTLSGTGSMTLAGRGSHLITTNTKIVTHAINVNGGGTYTLADAYTSNRNAGAIIATTGTFDTASYAIALTGASATISIPGGTFIGGTSTITMSTTATVTVWNFSAGSVSMASATINLIGVGTLTRTFTGGGGSYGTVTYTAAGSTGILSITGANTFNTINYSDVTNARTLWFGGGTNTITNFNASGTSGKLISVNAFTPGSLTTILAKGGTGYWSNDYQSIQDIKVAQPYVYFAGANSSGSANINVNLTIPPTAPYRNQGAGNFVSGGTTVTATLPVTAASGNLLALAFTSVGDPGTVTVPSGYIQALTIGTTQKERLYYKIAAGTETNAVVSWTSSATVDIWVWEIAGFVGAPTLDVTDTNSSASSVTTLSTTAGTGPTNAAPAYALVAFGLSGTGSASVSWTNSYQEEYLASSNRVYPAAKPLTAAAAQDTTHVWSTGRAVNAFLATFIGVPVLLINVSDSITVSESVSVNVPGGATPTVSVSDTITVTESLSLQIISYVNVSNSITISESLTEQLNSFVTVSDSLTVTESLQALLVSFGSVSDSITVSESLSVVLQATTTLTINVSDSITVSEQIAVVLQAVPTLAVAVSDSITVTESLATMLTSFIRVSDSITVTESVSVVAQALATLLINVNDPIAVTESVLVSIFTTPPGISTLDSPTHSTESGTMTSTSKGPTSTHSSGGGPTFSRRRLT